MLRIVAIVTSLAAHTALLEGLGAACGICSQEDTHPSDLGESANYCVSS